MDGWMDGCLAYCREVCLVKFCLPESFARVLDFLLCAELLWAVELRKCRSCVCVYVCVCVVAFFVLFLVSKKCARHFGL